MGWVIIPPLLIVGIGLTSFALKLQSEWQLERTRVLADLLPRVNYARKAAQELMVRFRESESGSIKTEDELISFLQNAAQAAGFTVDNLKVDRRSSETGANVPILSARVRGTGTLLSVQNFMGDVSSRQYLLSETSVELSQSGMTEGEDTCRAEITFELILFQTGKTGGGA
ncbi:hypothetical protein [Pontiella agarivorans]|uniref:General secretion pathway protein GspM n=1 Tax=Pontiella agarivorans TaxID=3038953 RepID=A0ABU5MYN8_9BACT|nr:hypothetical protein [Pontiella agarivorans]MDZ8119283.1 hypothetical protein [Pontiella agarivorans]